MIDLFKNILFFKLKPMKVDTSVLNAEQKAVWHAIHYAEGSRITQLQIARSLEWIGRHEEYDPKTAGTTTRKIRKIVQDLIKIHHFPVLSDVRGYYIPKKMSDVHEFVERKKRAMRARIKTEWEVYKAIKATYPYFEDKYMEEQGRLFDGTDF